jgi:hypothetical protein
MPFEPTPGRTNPITFGYTAGPDTACSGDECSGVSGGKSGAIQTENPRAAQQGLIDPRQVLAREVGPRGAAGGDVLAPERQRSRITLRIALLIAAVVTGLVLLVLPPIRTLLRRRRLRRAAAEPRRLILVAYELFTERARGVGLGRGPGETLEEYRRKVIDTGYLSDGHLDRLTSLATTAAYSLRQPDEDDARRAVEAADVALREIRRAVGPARWVVGLYRRR